MLGTVTEATARTGAPDGVEHGIVRDAPQRHHDPWRERLELRGEITVAGADLRGQGFVRGRQTLHRVRDPHALQL